MSNQLEGACQQSASWTLREEVTFDRHGVTSVDWHTYPILRSLDAPDIETVLLNRPGQPWLGVGEGAMGPTPAAIANAIYDAVGTRLRQIPFTAERVRAGVVRHDGLPYPALPLALGTFFGLIVKPNKYQVPPTSRVVQRNRKKQ